MRERTIRLVVNLDETERQMRLQRVDDRSRAAIAGIDHDFQRLERAGIDIAQQMGDVITFIGSTIPGYRAAWILETDHARPDRGWRTGRCRR